jgi:hypothetical protein
LSLDISSIRQLDSWARDLKEVFTLPDLKVALRERSEATLFRKIRELTSSKQLIKVTRGLYATPQASLKEISFRIDQKAYISMGTILAQHALIGSIPGYKVQAIKVGKTRIYTYEHGTIEHLGINEKYYFGYIKDNGCLRATPEKAFLDVWYFLYKGYRYSFNPQSDINTEQLNKQLLYEYLEHYDKRFKTFIQSNCVLP